MSKFLDLNGLVYYDGKIKDVIDEKSAVSVSNTGTATDEVQYITIDGVEKKLAGGGSGGIIPEVTFEMGDAYPSMKFTPHVSYYGDKGGISFVSGPDSNIAGRLIGGKYGFSYLFNNTDPNSDYNGFFDVNDALSQHTEYNHPAITAMGQNHTEFNLGNSSYKFHEGWFSQEIHAANIPEPPTSDGSYNLHLDIVDGVPTYSWEAATSIPTADGESF